MKMLLHVARRSLMTILPQTLSGLGQTTEQEPEFLQPLDNLTVTQGRDISFTCVVNNLGQYRVSLLAAALKLSSAT